MNKIYHDSDEKFVSAVVLYADADDGHVFFDEKKSQGVSKDELFDLYLKGLAVVVLDNEYFKPVTYAVESTAGKITCLKDSGEAATMLNFYSEEHGA